MGTKLMNARVTSAAGTMPTVSISTTSGEEEEVLWMWDMQWQHHLKRKKGLCPALLRHRHP